MPSMARKSALACLERANQQSKGMKVFASSLVFRRLLLLPVVGHVEAGAGTSRARHCDARTVVGQVLGDTQVLPAAFQAGDVSPFTSYTEKFLASHLKRDRGQKGEDWSKSEERRGPRTGKPPPRVLSVCLRRRA